MAALPEDVLFLICGELALLKDYDTLLQCALSSKVLAAVWLLFLVDDDAKLTNYSKQTAIPWLYRTYHDSPIKGGGSESLSFPQQELIMQKWVIMWRSIIVSSLSVESTKMPYCRYIRVLDFRDLEALLTDDKFRGKILNYFFEGPLKCLKHRIRKTFDLPKIFTTVGDSITAQAPMLERITGNVPPRALRNWTQSLKRLRSLELWDGQALDDEQTRTIIQENCPNFDSLSIFIWQGDQSTADSKLASFVSGLKQDALQFFEIISNAGVGIDTLKALNHHGRSLTELRLHLTADSLPHLSQIRACTSVKDLQLTESGTRTNLETSDREAFDEISTWLQSCKDLRSITFSKFMSGPALITKFLQNTRIQLSKLELDCYRVRERQELHLALVNQLELQTLSLQGDSDDATKFDLEIFVGSISELRSLKELELRGVSEDWSDQEIITVARNLVDLEELYVSGAWVTDDVLGPVATLAKLRSVTFNAITAFTFDGLMSFISKLGPGNEGIAIVVDMADQDSGLSELQQDTIKEALAARLGGRFDYQFLRDPDVSEFEGDSD